MKNPPISIHFKAFLVRIRGWMWFWPVLFRSSVPRPIIHPLSSPSNMFCVTSLDPDTLPSVATLLMDVMFYSGGWVFLSIRRSFFYPWCFSLSLISILSKKRNILSSWWRIHQFDSKSGSVVSPSEGKLMRFFFHIIPNIRIFKSSTEVWVHLRKSLTKTFPFF